MQSKAHKSHTKSSLQRGMILGKQQLMQTIIILREMVFFSTENKKLEQLKVT